MASQGTSYRRGRSERGFSRVNPVGFVSTAESYMPAAGITGPGKPQLGAVEVARSRPIAGQATGGPQSYAVYPTDTVTVSDALALASALAFEVSDTVAVSDAIGLGAAADVADTVAVSDAGDCQTTANPSATDTVTISDTTACLQVKELGLSETVTVTDACAPSALLSQAAADTVGVSDAAQVIYSQGAPVADTVTVSDAAQGQTTAQPGPAETVGASDALSLAGAQAAPVADTVTASDALGLMRSTTAQCVDTVGAGDNVLVVQSNTSNVNVLDFVGVTENLVVIPLAAAPVAETVAASDALVTLVHARPGLDEAVPLVEGFGSGTVQARASSSGRLIEVSLPEMAWEEASPLPQYEILASPGAYPLTLLDVDITTFRVASGQQAAVTGPYEVTLQDAPGGASLVGRYLTLTSALNPVTARVRSVAGNVLKVDLPLFLDPFPRPWRVDSGAVGATLSTTKMTAGATYTLRAFGATVPFAGAAPRPRLTDTSFRPEDGSLLLTFSDVMRDDPALTDPAEYSLTGPTAVEVRRVRTPSPSQVVLETAGFEAGSYTLTVNATGTPKDEAGNPIDPTFNQAVFGAVLPLATRSIFTDHGPIARPPLVLQTGVGVTIIDATTLVLTGAGLTSTVVGRYVRLVGTTRNDGEFRITSVVNATRVKVSASFSLPDAGASMAAWTVLDPRDGQIADDPAHVAVRVNGSPVTVESVIGLLGQIVLAAPPAPADDVKVDYSWICDPTVEIQRLNSREFRLNSKAQLYPGGSGHTYAYKNVLIQPGDYVATTTIQQGAGAVVTAPNVVTLPGANVLVSFVGLTLVLGGANAGVGFRITGVNSATSVTVSPNPLAGPSGAWSVVDDQANHLAQLSQPLQRDLKYRAYERAYSALLNDPSRLVLNTPLHKIAYPPMQRPLDEVFVSYQPSALPEADPTAPWTRLGAGTAALVGNRLEVEDTTTGPFPGGQPFFWTRPIDTTFPHVLAMTWQVEVPAVTVTEGVWTGLAVGYGAGERALVVGLLDDGGTPKVGILKAGAGNDPSQLAAWTGGLDNANVPTAAPVEFAWATLHSYRVLRGTDGVIRVYFDGAVVESLRVLESELPFLAELNDPFDQIQGVFFGSLSRPATSKSVWDFVRYTVLPTNPLQSSPSVFVTYEGNTIPEAASPLWTPVGYHGTEQILPSSELLLDSTSATTEAQSDLAGLVGGDFRGFLRLEPLLSASSDVVLDAQIQLRSFTHGPRPDAVMMAVDDGKHLLQLGLFPDRPSPLLGYGGRSLPTDWAPTPWTAMGGATAAMVGRTLRITDTSITDGLVYYVDDLATPTDDPRVIGTFDFVVEARCLVRSTTPDPAGFAGATVDVYDSTRAVGLMLEEVAGVRYATFHSEGAPVVGGQFAFEWLDGQAHTYRLVKSLGGDLVSLFIDATFIGAVAYSAFSVPPASPVGTLSFGSATAASQAAVSVVDWSYVNAWRLLVGIKRYAGLWKGTKTGTLRDFHLPSRAEGQGAVGGNVLSDPSASFFAQGVTVGDTLVIDAGDNAGAYPITGVTPTTVLVGAVFPVQPSVVGYRIPKEVDWSAPHRYRLVRAPTGVVTLLLDSDPQPLVRVDLNELNIPPSSAGIVSTMSGGMPAVAWGALDPTALTQTAWSFVRYGITRSPTEMRIVPQGMVLNQRNVMASPEHIFTNIPHAHTDFWAGSDGIPPKTTPDFLEDPSLVAFTLLNEGTPLVPSTQTAQVRNIQPIQVFVSALNTPEDVLNNDGDFTLNDGTTKIKIVYPDDVLYSCLDVLEKTTGKTDLIAPFCDDCPGPTFEGVQYQKEVCLSYDASTLPEDDTAAPTPWELVSDNPAQVTTTVFGGVLTYGTVGAGRTVYRNATPLPDAPSLTTEVKFRLKVAQDATFGLGDSQVRLGLSAAPNMTVALAFLTSPVGQRYVLVVDLTNNAVMAGILFDWYDGLFHTYRLVRNPGAGVLSVFVDS